MRSEDRRATHSILLEPKTVALGGNGVTTCIAAIVQLGLIRDDPLIVTVSDTKASFGGAYSTEGVMKTEYFHRQWTAMIAGNDVVRGDAVIHRAKAILRGKSGDFQVVMEGFKDAFKQQFKAALEDEILSPHDMKMSEFKRHGKAQLNAEIFADLSFRIKAFRLGCKFLVYGFDNKRSPHIFEVQDPGTAVIWDRLGFWAIGSGASSAISMLAALQQTAGVTGFAQTVYNVLAAKYASEGASDVGKETFLFVKKYGCSMVSNKRDLEPMVRSIWEAEGRPRTHDRAVQIIANGDFHFYPSSKGSRRQKSQGINIGDHNVKAV